jgi:hypothetical protein
MRAVLAGLLLLATAVPTLAQDAAPALRPHRFVLSGGVGWLGGYGIGRNTATLRRNQPGTTTPGPVPVFIAEGAIGRTASADMRVGFTLTRDLSLELGGSYSRPSVVVDISADSEAGEALQLSDQRESQYVVEVSGVWHLPRLRLGRRARPYLLGGGGYLRQLDIDRVKAETGNIFHAGGGVWYWMRGRDALASAAGIRGEVRVQFRSGGLDFEGKTRAAPAAMVLLFYAF